MKRFLHSLSFAFTVSLAACGDNAPALPDCAESVKFSPCCTGNQTCLTGRAVCWTGGDENPGSGTAVTGCLVPHDVYSDECVEACGNP